MISNKNRTKNIIIIALVLGIAAVMSMCLFACKQKTNNVTSTNQIKVDVNSPEVQATLGAVRNYEAEKLLPSGTAEREKQVWTKRNHKWAEPPEEDKIYAKDSSTGAWAVAYAYYGKEYWVTGANSEKVNKRIIYKKNSNNPEDVKNTDRVAEVSPDVNIPYSQVIAEMTLGEDISKNMRGNSDTINITK